jgi:hypothetical protein
MIINLIMEICEEIYSSFAFLMFYIVHELIIIAVIFGLIVVCLRIIESKLYRDYIEYDQKILDIKDLSRKSSQSDD